MEPTTQQYVEHALAMGKTKEHIYQELLANGWTLAEIASSFPGPSIPSPVAKDQPEDTEKKTISIITVIGAVLIGAGVFSFIAANWDGMSKALKVIIILISLIGVDSLGWYLREKKGYAKSGGALYLLGGIIYGAGIFLVGQIFNIRLNWPDAYMLWMLGTLIMAFAIDFWGLFIISVLAGMIAIVGQPIILLDNPLSLSRFAFTPAILLIISFAVCAAAGFYIRKKVPVDHKGYF